MANLQLRPSEIYFSTDTLSNRSWDNRLIGEELDDYVEGRQNIIPRLKVTFRDNRWVTCNNRRLWILRQLERLGICRFITATRVDVQQGDGNLMFRDIRIIGDPGGRHYRNDSSSWSPEDVFAMIGVIVGIGLVLFKLKQ